MFDLGLTGLTLNPIVRYDRRRQMAAGSLGKGLFTVLYSTPLPSPHI